MRITYVAYCTDCREYFTTRKLICRCPYCNGENTDIKDE